MATAIQMPFESFLDTDGTPLNNGKIYIGTVNQNPISNPITVYWDSALTIPASQPIRTKGGFPARQGTASSVFVTDDYSIIIRNQSDVTLFSQLTGSPFSASALLAKIKTVDGSGSGLIAEGLQSVQITDLNFDPSLLGLAVRETRIYSTSSGPTNPPAGSSATYWTLVLSNPATGEFRLVAYPNGATQNIYTRTWVASAWSSWQTGGGFPISLTTGSSPYSLVAGTTPELLISATTNPYIVNLPAATGSGYRVKIVNTSALATGLVKIVPATGEQIGPIAVDVACYLQNVDQSAWAFAKQEIDLVDVATGQWAIAGGQFMPEPGSVDAAGTQYHLGKLRLLPLGNTSNRNLPFNPLPAVGAFTSINVTGTLGVPSKAKAILVTGHISAAATAAGAIDLRVAFSDNNTNNPTTGTGHPIAYVIGKAVAGADVWGSSFSCVIPLNSAGQMYAYTIQATNVTVANSQAQLRVQGYYMGD